MMSKILSVVKAFHKNLIYGRRVQVLAALLSKYIPDNAIVLDVGCGEGTIAYLLKQKNPSLECIGLEVTDSFTFKIPHKLFDGEKIPLKNNEVDVCIFVDVLHHTENIEVLLKEAKRVAKKNIIIKDHLCETKYDFLILKLMDWTGNKPHGIPLIYKYKSEEEWKALFSALHLEIVLWSTDVPLYKFPLNKICGRNLHFIAALKKKQ